MADTEQHGHLDALCEYCREWDEPKPGENPVFHMPWVHPFLIQHIDQLTGGNEGLRFLLPMRGKSLDIKWLQEKGHTVVGVEFVEKAAQDFFEENGIEPSVSEEPSTAGGKLYKGLGGKISIYICNYFDFNRYVDLTKSLMKPNARYMMETFEYNEDQGHDDGHGHNDHHGNEHGHGHHSHGEGGKGCHITGEQVKALFGHGYEMACLEDKDSTTVDDFAKQFGCISLIYFLKPK